MLLSKFKEHIAAHRDWWVLAAMSTCLALSFIDMTAVPISLPQIQRLLQSTDVQLQWIVNAYLLALTVFIIMGGRFGDMYGHRRIFLVGALIFFVASIICAVAPSTGWIIGGRALQGLGGALLIPTSSVIIINAFAPENRGKAMGIYVGSASVFLAFGPAIGGVLTGLVSWRFVFWINIPLIMISVILTWLSVQKDQMPHIKNKMDWLGLMIMIITLSALTAAIMEGYNLGWKSYELMALIIITIIGFLLFIYVEKHNQSPLVDFSIFNNKAYLAGIMIIFCIQFGLISTVFRGLWMQDVLNYTPAITGLLVVPGTLPILFMSPLAGRLLDKYGVGLPALWGITLSFIGMLFTAATAFLQNYWIMLPGVIFLGLGVPLVMVPVFTGSLSSVDLEKRGVASGVLNATRQMGGTLGLALLGAIITATNFSYLSHDLSKQLPQITPAVAEKIMIMNTSAAATALTPQQFALLRHINNAAYTTAFAISSYVAAIFLFGAFFLVYYLRKMRVKH